MGQIVAVDVAKSKTIERFMLDMVWAIHGRTSSYTKIAELLNKEFAMDYSERDVARYFDLTIEEEVEDLKLIYEHCIK